MALEKFWKTIASRDKAFNMGLEQSKILGASAAILSPQNRNPLLGFTQLTEQQNGYNKEFIYQWRQRVLQSSIQTTAVDGAPNYCNPKTAPEYFDERAKVEKDFYVDFTIPESKVRDWGEGAKKAYDDAIMALRDALARQMDSITIANLEASRGNTSAGNSTIKTAQGFTNYDNRVKNLQFRSEIVKEFRKLDYKGDLIWIGDGMVFDYVNTLEDGAVIADRGQNMASRVMRDMYFYDDNSIDSSVSGTDNLYIIQPGSFQWLNWYQNEGEFRSITDRGVNDTITIAFKTDGGLTLNMKFDIMIRYTNCDDDTTGMHITIRKHYDFWKFPTNFYAAGDVLNGVNGIQRWQMTAAS